MPTYDYHCANCGHRFEVIHGLHTAGPETCPNCGKGPVRKRFVPPTIHFKGTGWAKKERRASAAGTKESSSTGTSGSSSGDGEKGGSTETSKPKDGAGEPAKAPATGGSD